MVKIVTIRQTGTSLSATIPKEMTERFHLGVGDRVFAVEREDGVLFTPNNPPIARPMQANEPIANRNLKGLRPLPKKKLGTPNAWDSGPFPMNAAIRTKPCGLTGT